MPNEFHSAARDFADGKFYIVLRAPDGSDWTNVVKHPHPGYPSAMAEAERLCRETGKRFVVLAAIAWCSPSPVPVVWHENGFPDA